HFASPDRSAAPRGSGAYGPTEEASTHEAGHATKRVGAPLVSGGATRDDSPSEDARAGDPPPSRQGLSRLGTHARIHHPLRAAGRDDPRGAGAGRTREPGHAPTLQEVPRTARLSRRRSHGARTGRARDRLLPPEGEGDPHGLRADRPRVRRIGPERHGRPDIAPWGGSQ